MGTRIFLGGGIGYVAWEGTQFKTNVPERNGVPCSAGRNLAVIGDLRGMSTEFVRALNFHGYGLSLAVGIGVPIPILDEEVMRAAAVTDEEIFAPVLDYAIQSRNRKAMMEVSYAQLRSGTVELFGKKVKTSSLSSYYKARIIAKRLQAMIEEDQFILTKPVAPMPAERVQRPLEVCSREEVL
jgi:L-aspartate semialdehyde sulfurtransferase